MSSPDSHLRTRVFRHAATKPFTYADLLREQEQARLRVRNGAAGELLLAEVAPVITRGRRTPSADLYHLPATYAERGVEILDVDRGGLATYHGPGQWVLFPTVSLESWSGDARAVRAFVCDGLQRILAVAREYAPLAEIRERGEWGIFGRSGKIASCGIRVRDGVTMHGFSINVYRTPLSFWGVRGCGLEAQPEFLLDREDDDEFARAGRLLAAAWA